MRGRLFRKYFLLVLALVCGALAVSGATSLYFSYEESKAALAALQEEKAVTAATHIEQFLRRIEEQLAYAAPQLGGEPLEQRRLELVKLQRFAKDVTDVAEIGADGRERLFESRLAMSVVGSGRDRSREPAFRAARPGQAWFGPVYFRKETEPYMTVAVRSRAAGPVIVADVNLKFMWDVVNRIGIGKKGKAYVVDRSGYLIADPDIGLVLRKTDLSGLAQVKAALAGEGAERAMVAADPGGRRVLTAWAPVEPPGWRVFVEQPTSEVFQALDASIVRNLALIVGGLIFSALAAAWLARSMARPIGVLEEGAQRIGAGELDHEIAVRTGDELEALAGQFNRMTAQLRESYAGLERKVEERTAELRQSLEFQKATGDILTSISGSIADTQPVFDAIVQSMRRLFGTRSALVALVQDGQFHLKAIGASDEEYNRRMRAAFPRPVDDPDSIAARALRTGKVLQLCPVIGNPEAPASTVALARQNGFDSILIAPMLREGKPLGIIATSRVEPVAFDDKQVALIKAFADQAVIAIENVRLFNETKEALERQTAISDVLRAISGSPTDVQPVLDAVAERAGRLCNSFFSAVLLADAGGLRAVSVYIGAEPPGETRAGTVVPIRRTSINGRAFLERRSIHVEDVLPLVDSEYPDARENQRQFGFRTMLSVPMLREQEAIGTISVYRPEVRPFSREEIALLETFAAQAVIAIENVRLFNETREALERQTATADVLRVISSSPTSTQPVFDAILESATRLCDAQTGILFRYDGDAYHAIATRIPDPRNAALFAKPLRPAPDSMTGLGRIRRERRAVHIPDMLNDPAYDARDPVRMESLQAGLRSWLGVPMLKDGALVGAIVIYRGEPRPFAEQQITLLQTFADQAVIAIENVRLFNETKEALEHQTATSEILGVISSSPTRMEPVFDAIVASAARLFPPCAVHINMLEAGRLYRRARAGPPPLIPAEEVEALDALFPIPVDGKSSISTMAMAAGRVITIPDTWDEGLPELARRIARLARYRSSTVVPLLREGQAIGTISLSHPQPGFVLTEKQLALVQTFADQAVIAIENVRLFTALQSRNEDLTRALEQQTATGEILKVISGSPTDIQPVFHTITLNAVRLCDATWGALFTCDGETIDLAAIIHSNEALVEAQRRAFPRPVSKGTPSDDAILERRILNVADIEESEYSAEVKARARAGGFRSVLTVPIMRSGVAAGVLLLVRAGEPRKFTEQQVALVSTFADQAVIAIENVRLFKEIQEKSAQLEVANKHKSDFLANMSHELRTPLNAIIGFSEVLMDRMFGEVNQKQAEYLKDIHESGRHLLSLINDILDLSKIEAGRMDLELSRFDLPGTLANAMTLVRERAQRHNIRLGLEVDKRLGEFQADERKVKQILLNLLSNAVKFTPDGGRVDVAARLDTTHVEIAVKDSGVGIAPEDQQAVFEEFKQVGRDYTRKAEGTGLGLALTRKFVELHGGEIRLESASDKGSTFTFTLPVRP